MRLLEGVAERNIINLLEIAVKPQYCGAATSSNPIT